MDESDSRALNANQPEPWSLSLAEEAALARFDREPQLRSAAFQPTDLADDGSWFEGYAAVFDEDARYEVPGIGMISESVVRGAFRKVLAEQRESIPLLYHHLQEHPPLAVYHRGGGTLHLEERAKGLWTRANVARTYIGDAVRELVKRGDIPGMSWGFISQPRMSRIERRTGGIHRTIQGFKKILDVAPTWDVTYRGTTAEFRSRALGIAVPSWVEEEHAVVGDQEQSDEQASLIEPERETVEMRSAGIDPAERESDSGVIEPVRTIAARKRALDLFIAETGDVE